MPFRTLEDFTEKFKDRAFQSFERAGVEVDTSWKDLVGDMASYVQEAHEIRLQVIRERAISLDRVKALEQENSRLTEKLDKLQSDFEGVQRESQEWKKHDGKQAKEAVIQDTAKFDTYWKRQIKISGSSC